MKLSNLSAIIASFSISAILYYFKGWLKEMGIIIPDWVVCMIGVSGLIYVAIITLIDFLKNKKLKIQNRGRGRSKEISVNIKKKLEKIRESILLTISEHPKSEIIEIAEILSIKPGIAAFHIKELEISKFVKVAHMQGSVLDDILYREEWSTDQIGRGYLIHHKLI